MVKRESRITADGTVTGVAEQYLCNSCGACAVVCPVGAVSYYVTVGGYLFPRVDESACTVCGRCLTVCPGVHFGKTLEAGWPSDPFVGETTECFLGRAVDDEIYAGSQSGGVVTALLVYALRQGLVQAAIVSTMRLGQPPTVEPTIATTKQQILAARKSKYAPVAMLEALTEVEARDLTVAVVGLSCQLHGLHNLCDVRPQLKDRVPLRIGLICDRTMTASAVDFLIAQSGMKSGPCELRFRDKTAGGWPGDVKVISGDGRSAVMPSRVRTDVKDAFTPPRCRLCFDKLNVFADLVIGDPWGIDNADKVNGECAVICRSAAGSEFLKAAAESRAITLRPIQYGEVVKGQKVEDRRHDWREYCEAWKHMGFELPNYYERVSEHAPYTSRRSYHERNLRNALSLDGFASRAAIVSHVQRQLLFHEWAQRLLLPIRLTRGAMRRLYRLVWPHQRGGLG